MKRGHIRVGRGFGKEAQEKVLREHGVTIFYYDDPASAWKSQRRGEVLYVVGLRGLAGSKDGIVKFLKELHKRDAAAVDVATGRRSDGKDGAELMAEAAVDLTNERMGGHRASKKFGQKGGEISGKKRMDRKTPLGDAEKIWFDLTLGNAEAVDKINTFGYPDDWTYGALYHHLEKRGATPGRRSKK